MKRFATVSMVIFAVCLWQDVLAQHPRELQPGYYVVVAAFSPSREDFAQRYTDKLKKQGMDANYGFNTKRNFFYVYVKDYDQLDPSLKKMRETRKTEQDEFPKAWVRIINEAGEVVAVTENDPPPSAVIPPADKKVQTAVSSPSPVQETPQPMAALTQTPDTIARKSEEIVVTDNPEIVQFAHMDLNNTEVFLSLFNATNNKVVEGRVKVVDSEKSKIIKEVDGNDYLYLPDPKNKSGQVTLICEAFGYRKVQHELSYPLPLADTSKAYIDLMGTTFIVYFDLVRYHKGDRATLFHVYFFNDAAIMLPESKFELTSLLEMMQENPHYRVRLHGHTNGNYHGRIILMGDENRFFSLDGSRNSSGSAKDLSRERAEVIKKYLVSNGVADDRVEIKAWGGKKPLYDRHGANAKKNVRVEVEIIDD